MNTVWLVPWYGRWRYMPIDIHPSFLKASNDG